MNLRQMWLAIKSAFFACPVVDGTSKALDEGELAPLPLPDRFMLIRRTGHPIHGGWAVCSVALASDSILAAKLVAKALGIERAARYLRNTGMPVASQLAILALIVQGPSLNTAQPVAVVPAGSISQTRPAATPAAAPRTSAMPRAGIPESALERLRELKEALLDFDIGLQGAT